MLGISYTTWKKICNMYFSLPDASKKAYLQWFPFWKLSEHDKNVLSSKTFFDRYIKTGSFVFFPPVMSHSENYIQKADGSFRNSSLISPILFLVLQSLGNTIHDHYRPERVDEMEVFYAGNYELNRVKYNKDYDDFYKSVNAWSENYQYFIKTDIYDFYGSISVDKLIRQIDHNCNFSQQIFSQTQLLLLKELLLYCGNGRFPLIENSIATSFLSTIVYLDKIDCKLYEYIKKYVPEVKSYKMLRYVDDLYIFISTEDNNDSLAKAYNSIRNEYSSILKEWGLSINSGKCKLKRVSELNDELKKSLYADYVAGEDNNIPELFKSRFNDFVHDVEKTSKNNELTHETYEFLIKKHFSADDIEYTAHEVYNHLIFDSSDKWDDEVTDTLVRIIDNDVTVLALDPKSMAVMVMRSEQEKAIKAMLYNLFRRSRQGIWNSYDTTIAISYLIQSRFNHIDLLNVLKTTAPKLFNYYINACKCSFVNQIKSEKWNLYIDFIDGDSKAAFLFFMYIAEQNKCNYLSEYAFYKNFFDRISADMSFKVYAGVGREKKPNYNRYYQEKDLKRLYKGIKDSDSIIAKASRLRNSNPLDHASAELIDKDTTREELHKSVEELDYLINQFAVNNMNSLL